MLAEDAEADDYDDYLMMFDTLIYLYTRLMMSNALITMQNATMLRMMIALF